MQWWRWSKRSCYRIIDVKVTAWNSKRSLGMPGPDKRRFQGSSGEYMTWLLWWLHIIPHNRMHNTTVLKPKAAVHSVPGQQVSTAGAFTHQEGLRGLRANTGRARLGWSCGSKHLRTYSFTMICQLTTAHYSCRHACGRKATRWPPAGVPTSFKKLDQPSHGS